MNQFRKRTLDTLYNTVEFSRVKSTPQSTLIEYYDHMFSTLKTWTDEGDFLYTSIKYNIPYPYAFSPLKNQISKIK